LVLQRGPDGHSDYLPPPTGGPSERMDAAAAALVSGAAASVAAALRVAGYAHQGGAQAETVKAHAAEVAEREGLTLPAIIRTVRQGLDANITRMVVVEGERGGRERIEEPDTDARLRAAEIGLRVHGVGHERASGSAVTVVIMPMRELQVPESKAIEVEVQQ